MGNSVHYSYPLGNKKRHDQEDRKPRMLGRKSRVHAWKHTDVRADSIDDGPGIYLAKQYFQNQRLFKRRGDLTGKQRTRKAKRKRKLRSG